MERMYDTDSISSGSSLLFFLFCLVIWIIQQTNCNLRSALINSLFSFISLPPHVSSPSFNSAIADSQLLKQITALQHQMIAARAHWRPYTQFQFSSVLFKGSLPDHWWYFTNPNLSKKIKVLSAVIIHYDLMVSVTAKLSRRAQAAAIFFSFLIQQPNQLVNFEIR